MFRKFLIKLSITFLECFPNNKKTKYQLVVSGDFNSLTKKMMLYVKNMEDNEWTHCWVLHASSINSALLKFLFEALAILLPRSDGSCRPSFLKTDCGKKSSLISIYWTKKNGLIYCEEVVETVKLQICFNTFIM